MSDPLLTDLRALRRKALAEHSHRYTASVIQRAIREIENLFWHVNGAHDRENEILKETESLSRQLSTAFREVAAYKAKLLQAEHNIHLWEEGYRKLEEKAERFRQAAIMGTGA